MRRFWSYGFRGADLIVACYGPAVGVFGKYERVEKADGTPVGIPELLDLARQAARDAIAGEFRGDSLSTLYYVWANLYGAAEQAWDDARLVVQIGGDEDNAMEVARGLRHLRLGWRKMPVGTSRRPRQPQGAWHRSELAAHRCTTSQHAPVEGGAAEGPSGIPRATGPAGGRAILETGTGVCLRSLPRDLEDWKLVNALLGERGTLRAEGKSTAYSDVQGRLFPEGGDGS